VTIDGELLFYTIGGVAVNPSTALTVHSCWRLMIINAVNTAVRIRRSNKPFKLFVVVANVTLVEGLSVVLVAIMTARRCPFAA